MSVAWGEINVGELLVPLRGSLVSGNPETILSGLSTDSREVKAGEIFLALKGEKFDGHDFIGKAIAKGAAGIIVEKGYTERPEFPISHFYERNSVVVAVEDTLASLGELAKWWRQKHQAKVVAITGSVGKTTTKEMTAAILSLSHKTLRNEGNLNNLIGLPLTMLQLEKDQGRAVLEMGMNRTGEIARLTEIADPDVGVITNVAMAHLEGVGDLQGVARAKAELAEKMSPNGRLIVNGEDRLLLAAVSVFRKDMITFGLEKSNDVWASNTRSFGLDGVAFELQYRRSSWPVRLRVPGLQNVLNSLAAAAVCFCLGEPPNMIQEGLGTFRSLKGRFVVLNLPRDVILVDDTYNANPESLRAALESLSTLIDERTRLIVGLGEMMELGESTREAHVEAGRRVARLNPQLFLAMGEHAVQMIDGAVQGGLPESRGQVVHSHQEMAMRIKGEMEEGALIFVKGSRRMALERVIDDLKKEAA